MTTEHVRSNQAAWDRMASSYQDIIDRPEVRGYRWGWWRHPDDALGVLGDLDDRRVLDLGCGAAQGTAVLASMGAQAVGMDLSAVQLSHAAADARAAVRLLQADAEQLPFPAEAFDLVISNWGALSFADPDTAVLEASRVLKPDGRLVVCTASPIYWLATSEGSEQPGPTLERSMFELDRWPGASGTVRFQRSYADWVALFLRHSLAIDGLLEPPTPNDADLPAHLDRDAWRAWLDRWPFDTIWVTRKGSPAGRPGRRSR